MANEGDVLLMAELIKEEKRLEARLAETEARLEEPRRVLAVAAQELRDAQERQAEAQQLVQRFEVAHGMVRDELAAIRARKSDLRVETRVAEGDTIRRGTSQLVDQLQAITGDDSEVASDRLQRASDIEAELAAMKAEMASDDPDGL